MPVGKVRGGGQPGQIARKNIDTPGRALVGPQDISVAEGPVYSTQEHFWRIGSKPPSVKLGAGVPVFLAINLVLGCYPSILAVIVVPMRDRDGVGAR
jgi:hypothetical protein